MWCFLGFSKSGTHQFHAFAVGSAMALEVVYADYDGSKQ